jgi:hypothetical protein
MQWRYLIDKERSAETWEGLSNDDDQKVFPGRISQTSGGSGDNVSPQE